MMGPGMTDRGMTDRQHEMMACIMVDLPVTMPRLGRADRSAQPEDADQRKAMRKRPLDDPPLYPFP